MTTSVEIKLSPHPKKSIFASRALRMTKSRGMTSCLAIFLISPLVPKKQILAARTAVCSRD